MIGGILCGSACSSCSLDRSIAAEEAEEEEAQSAAAAAAAAIVALTAAYVKEYICSIFK